MVALKYKGLVESQQMTHVFQNFCAILFILTLVGIVTFTHFMSTKPEETKRFLHKMNNLKSNFVRKLAQKLC